MARPLHGLVGANLVALLLDVVPMMRTATRWKLALVMGIVVLSSLPYLVGWLNANEQRAYVGRQPTSVADTGPYYSNIEQVRQGRILVENQFTSEPQEPSLFHPLWILLGWIAALAHLSTPVVFHLSRLVAVVAFILIIDRGLQTFMPDWRRRYTTLAILATSSGLGWVIALWTGTKLPAIETPVDIWVSEANTFLSLGHSSLFICSQLILAAVYWAAYQLTQGRRTMLVGPLLLLIGSIHPYDLVPAAIVVGVWVGGWLMFSRSDRRQWTHIITILASWWVWTLPLIPYYLYLVLRQPAMVGWLRQNVDITPFWPAVVLGYGLLWPLAWYGAKTWWSEHRTAALFAICWISVTLLLAYVPGLSFQRRLLNGVHIPIAVLASVGLFRVVERVVIQRWRTVVIALIAVALAITNLKLLETAVTKTLQPALADYPVYERRDVLAGIAWLRDHSRFGEPVLSQVWNGNTIAGLAARTVVLGHGHQTIQPLDRWHDWDTVVNPQSTDQQRREVIDRLGVV
ncbi:MAG: hypothetical protein HY976_03710, partial [Candidatus Kerfeldbacteria bacterium]|nr:hypothetical protein [Candidatus Kerfeldbacteria bacterium]